ncbi:MAG: S1 family serine peptidase [Thermomicrobiales bacterium]
MVGGTIVKDVEKYPFMVAVDDIQYDGPYYCGGTLIAPRYVLTAAHCVANDALDGYLPPDDFRVAIGYLDREAIPDSGWMTVKRVIPEPAYIPSAFYLGNDAALLELSAPVKGVDVAQLPASGDRSFEGTRDPVTAIGWGGKYRYGPDSKMLREVGMRVDKAKTCKELFETNLGLPYVSALLICASAPGKSTCQGDSGGPILAKDGARWVQDGVTSGAVGCAMTGWPPFYTRLSNPDVNAFVRDAAGIK